MALKIEPIANDDERQWCARLLSSNDPWVTLRRNFEACYAALGLESKERFLISEDDVRAGVLILDRSGPFPGYIQTIALAPKARSRGLGRRVIAWAEERILSDSPNVFILVSSFNVRAQQLYTSLGYETIGTSRGYIVGEHDELLLRKTRGGLLAAAGARGVIIKLRCRRLSLSPPSCRTLAFRSSP